MLGVFAARSAGGAFLQAWTGVAPAGRRAIASYAFASPSANVASKWAARSLGGIRCASREPIGTGDLRKGMIFLLEGKYVEVEEWRSSKIGRGSQQYKVAYKDLETGVPGDVKFGGTGKVTRVEPDKISLVVSYVEKDMKKVVCADEDFNEVVADQRATQAILKKALDRLKETYGFLQEEESQPEQMTHSKNPGGGGALAMIEEIMTESKDLEMKALGDEQASQAAYEGYVKDSNKAITAATTDIANKADSKAKADQALAEADGDLKSTIDTILKLGDMSAELHSQCDFLLKNFEARQSARTEEIDALNQAKQIFSSAR